MNKIHLREFISDNASQDSFSQTLQIRGGIFSQLGYQIYVLPFTAISLKKAKFAKKYKQRKCYQMMRKTFQNVETLGGEQRDF